MRLSLFLLALLVVAGCRTVSPLYTADAITPETAVDGQATEWPNALRPVPGEAGLSLGLRRDADALVVAVIAGDERQARRIALGGLRIWVDPMGGRDRVLGLRFPAPDALGEREISAQDRPRRGGPMDDGLRRRFNDALDAIEITRGDAEPVRQLAGSVDGLVTAATWTDRGLVIEMRLPLGARPDLLAAGVGPALGLGIELVEVRQAPPRARPQGGRGGGRVGGQGPDPDAQFEERERPSSTVETVTRWLRIER